MSTFRKAAVLAVALASFTGLAAAQSAFAQMNHYSRVEAGAAYLGPNGAEDSGLNGLAPRRGFSPYDVQGEARDTAARPFNDVRSFFNGS